MPTQLSLYSGALRIVGERRLANLTENREPRYLLDEIWEDDAIRAVLELGQWNFAIRSGELTFSPSMSSPDFGYRYAFDRPTDLVRTIGVSADAYFTQPLTAYRAEGAYWWSDTTPIYIRYISDDDAYGRDMSLWPRSFVKLMQSYLAKEIAPRLKNFGNVEMTEAQFRLALADAKAKDAMESPSMKLPPGSWVRSRGSMMGRGDTR